MKVITKTLRDYVKGGCAIYRKTNDNMSVTAVCTSEMC